MITLMVEIFAGKNFLEFRDFFTGRNFREIKSLRNLFPSQIRELKSAQNFWNSQIRETEFSQNFIRNRTLRFTRIKLLFPQNANKTCEMCFCVLFRYST